MPVPVGVENKVSIVDLLVLGKEPFPFLSDRFLSLLSLLVQNGARFSRLFSECPTLESDAAEPERTRKESPLRSAHRSLLQQLLAMLELLLARRAEHFVESVGFRIFRVLLHAGFSFTFSFSFSLTHSGEFTGGDGSFVT